MTSLDRLIPSPRIREIDVVDLAAPPDRVWEHVRHGDLARSRIARVLFAARTLLTRARMEDRAPVAIRLNSMKSSPERPGFQILVDDPPREVAVAAIGKVWRVDIPFVHVASADEYAAFADKGFIKVAWAIRVSPPHEVATHVECEVRVDATDDESWRKFRRYFHVIGPWSRFIRRAALRALAREFGTPEEADRGPLSLKASR
jgi:hypothetical protein